ncbi:hypothetical protein Nepgr_026284 [Nepenthes gracilis]|uniref:Uncharacterized protein n=1 Tax=Nepenthes gracilis TaxID=150966 RepID=A0AAD3T9F1_NEPGR|nr:hypothetical protein Nepgr_026284 [Nepenthes gracilis]
MWTGGRRWWPPVAGTSGRASTETWVISSQFNNNEVLGSQPHPIISTTLQPKPTAEDAVIAAVNIIRPRRHGIPAASSINFSSNETANMGRRILSLSTHSTGLRHRSDPRVRFYQNNSASLRVF